GPRTRLPSRRKIGELLMSRIVILLIVTSSSNPPSTVSSASPRQYSKTQFEIVIFFKLPLDAVPNLMRPVGLNDPSCSLSARFVLIFKLSIVRLSTPVARIAKCPPCKIVMSRMITLRQSLRLIDLFPHPGSTSSRGFG